MNFELSEEQLAFQHTAQQFAENQLAPHAQAWDAGAIFSREAFRAAGELGFMAMNVPTAAGGSELSRLDSLLIMEQLATGCTSTAAFISIHNMAFNMLARYGTPALQAKWNAALSQGEKLASYCLTEPGAGSDAAALITRAVREGDHYVVDGAKAFISGAGDTDILITMVRTGAPDSGAAGISCLAIPANLPGIAFGKKEEKLGWNSQPTRVIAFDGVRVPVDHLLANEGDGFKLAMEGLDGGRINIAACSTGTAATSLTMARDYVKERSQFKRAIADFQATQFKLADMLTELTAARQMCRLAAARLDQNHPEKSVFCAMAKRYATDVGFRICDEALQLHGGYGYLRDYPIERHFRDTRVHRILEGTNEIMRLIIARRWLQDDHLTLLDG